MTTQWAPAKLAVELGVVGTRADGYHLLEAEMVTIDLADRLDFAEGSSLDVLDAGGARTDYLGAEDDNLVSRALERCGRTAAVTLHKTIPIGGGLGGGSADAAAVLRWAGVTDRATAAALGADVPFCVVGGRAAVGGIGEQVTPLGHRDAVYTLVLPALFVATPAVYAAYDELGAGPVGLHRNDLEAAACAVEPRLAAVRDALHELTGVTATLAGSGSTWFFDGPAGALGLTPGATAVAGVHCRVIEVRAVPAGWAGPER